MLGTGRQLPTALLLLVALLSGSCLLLTAAAAGEAVPHGDQDHLRRLFDTLDKDHDGQLRRQELKQYIGGLAEYSSSSKLELDQAVQAAIGRLDSPDVGLDVSWKELEHHLHTLLQVRSITSITSIQRASACCHRSIHSRDNSSCILPRPAIGAHAHHHAAAETRSGVGGTGQRETGGRNAVQGASPVCLLLPCPHDRMSRWLTGSHTAWDCPSMLKHSGATP